MKTATLITGLVKQTVEIRGRRNDIPYRIFDMPPLYTHDGDMLFPLEEKINVVDVILPITQFCRPGRPDIYIAYSPEVEDLLGIPIRVLLSEKDAAYSSRDAAYAERDRLASMTAWQHIKKAWSLLWQS